jgi:amidophosphoribosyltransferase
VPDLDPRDTWREECGVFAARTSRPTDLATLAQLGLFALQHRGQESAGITVSNGREVRTHRGMGLVAQVFDEAGISRVRASDLTGVLGHVRYSTTGSSRIENAQPVTLRCSKGMLALAHNGNIVNARPLRDRLMAGGFTFQTSGDTEVMANLIASHADVDTVEATVRAMGEVEGGFTVGLLDEQRVLGLRDRHGVRPLLLGRIEDHTWIIASEPAAIEVVGGEVVRDVSPGELVVLEERGPRSVQALEPTPAPCSFEYIYFARADSRLDGTDVHAARVRMGEQLWREAAIEADVVIGVPESGLAAAIGYSRAGGIPYDIGLLKSPYAGRTFIQPTQALREEKVRLKLAATSAVAGKRVVLVDDSIVRGTTSAKIVQILREAGATQVHFRVSSPPLKFPCHYGIDIDSRKHLIAADHSIEEVRRQIGADSLHHLSEAGLRAAVGARTGLCLACFNGEYPAGEPAEADKLALERR